MEKQNTFNTNGMVNTLTVPPSEWVKKTMAAMTLEEKLGQLITSRGSMPDIEESISKGIVGNLYVGNETPPERIQRLQSLAKVPLLISADLEVGFIYHKNSWPTALSLAAVGDTDAGYKWGYYQGLEARENGINSVYGPVLDVILNPAGIMTGTRTLGGDAALAAKLAVQVVKGYQDAGIWTFAKHFPGFGRGWEDAHFEISNCDTDRETLYREDILPYIHAVQEAELAGIMTGHVRIPGIDPETPMPLSKKIFSILDDIHFRGLTVTDSLAMKGLTLEYPAHVLYPGCLAAGHDLLLTDYFVPDQTGHELLKKGLADGILTEQMIDQKVERILKAKEYLMNFHTPAYDAEEHKSFFRELSEKSITYKGSAPFELLPKEKKPLFIVVIQTDSNVQGELGKESTDSVRIRNAIMEKYPDSQIEVLPEYPNSRCLDMLLFKCSRSDAICFIGIADQHAYSGTANYSKPVFSLVSAIKKKIHTLVTVGNPYAVMDLPPFRQTLFCYNGGQWIESIVKVLSGEITPAGKLPVSLRRQDD
jgi:beta-N-acetylhexosaminidase